MTESFPSAEASSKETSLKAGGSKSAESLPALSDDLLLPPPHAVKKTKTTKSVLMTITIRFVEYLIWHSSLWFEKTVLSENTVYEINFTAAKYNCKECLIIRGTAAQPVTCKSKLTM
jgi:hypothetical protein